jgi:hypothetical protein
MRAHATLEGLAQGLSVGLAVIAIVFSVLAHLF